MKKHNYKYDVIRIVLTVLVVIGHANYYNAGNAYGGIYIADQMSAAGIADTAFHGFAEQIKQLIYTFHMPAFFALSGTLFYSQLKNGRFNSVTEVVKNKISRLVVPFVFVYLFWNTPILQSVRKYMERHFDADVYSNQYVFMVFGGIVF